MSVPATSGPTKAMKRGALKQKLTAVARMRVGNASGNHTGHHVYWPSEKDPFTAQATSTSAGRDVQRNSTGVRAHASTNHTRVAGRLPQASAQKPKPTYPQTAPML